MKEFVKLAFVVIFAAIAGYGVYVNQKSDAVSDLLIANVEALASDESDAKDGFIRSSYNDTISETEKDGYTEIVWEYVVICIPGGSVKDCTESRDRYTTIIHHS